MTEEARFQLHMHVPRTLALCAVLILALVVLSGCDPDRRAVIRIDGSSTVFPIAEAAAEEYAIATRGRVNVGFSGTGGGMEKFCRGETEMANASRHISDSELATCAAEGIDDIIELEVAIDALTVMVNPGNDFVECLTAEELHETFRTGGAQRWSDIRPEWPDRNLILYYPGTDSGTFDYFVEAVIEGVDEEATHRGDGIASEDDNILAIGIERDLDAIGYFGFAHFLEAGARLKAVAIDGGEGCIEPSRETAADDTYVPLSRPLFLYTREQYLRENEELQRFVRFLFEHLEELVDETGYVPLPEDQFQEQWAKVEPFVPDATPTPTPDLDQ